MEKAGAMNDWMIPTGAPQTGSVLGWGTHLKLQVKYLYLGIFYIFLGCCLASHSHSDGNCRKTSDDFDAPATSPTDLSPTWAEAAACSAGDP